MLNISCIFFIASVTVDPETPTIINGGVMFLTGPCFDDGKIKCVFTDKDGKRTDINGIIKNRKAICPMPLFGQLGEHTLTITVINDDRKYSGTFQVGEFPYIIIYYTV